MNGEGNEGNEGIAMQEEEKNFEIIRQDFFSCLLYEILKGDNGYLNEQAKPLTPLIINILTSENPQKRTMIVKSLNLIIQQEFKFYVKKQKQKDKKDHQDLYKYKLINFLSDLENSSKLKKSQKEKFD